MVNNEPRIHEGIVLYGMISRMRILSNPLVVLCAEQTVSSIIDASKKSLGEIRALMETGEAIDPLKNFSDISRAELRRCKKDHRVQLKRIRKSSAAYGRSARRHVSDKPDTFLDAISSSAPKA